MHMSVKEAFSPRKDAVGADVIIGVGTAKIPNVHSNTTLKMQIPLV